jgi:DNA topoisomerase-1
MDPRSIAAATGIRLHFCDDRQPGITRKRLGRGGRVAWAYYDPAGQRITDRAEIDRLNRIALPPAYEQAWFCPHGDGHLLATGIDARGRKQYRYHPLFRLTRESEKFDHTARFGSLLPRVRKRVEQDLSVRALCRTRAIASVVRLLDTGGIRVGNEAYAKANRSFGATTLRMRHVEVRPRALKLRFTAKSGKLREMTITDRSLLRFVRAMQDLPGQHLFQYVDEAGAPCPVSSGEVNDYLRETMGEAFTAKHFRTWHASAMAFELLATATGKLSVKALASEVSERLGNTPAIARKSYIHPAVLALVDGQEEWRKRLRLPRATRWLTRYERGLIALLEEAPAAAELLAG